MATDSIRPEPGQHALTVVEPGHDLHPARPTPPEDAARAGTTWDPHDRVPQADAEAEC